MFLSRYKVYTNLLKSTLLEMHVNFNCERRKDVMASAGNKVICFQGQKVMRANQAAYAAIFQVTNGGG